MVIKNQKTQTAVTTRPADGEVAADQDPAGTTRTTGGISTNPATTTTTTTTAATTGLGVIATTPWENGRSELNESVEHLICGYSK